MKKPAVQRDAAPSGEEYFGFWTRRPVGVIAAISLLNFPLKLMSRGLQTQ
jgi:hypothetical protein